MGVLEEREDLASWSNWYGNPFVDIDKYNFFSLPANPRLLLFFFSINFYVNKSVTLFCTIPLDRMATYGLDNHTLGGNDLLKLLYQPMMFQNLGSAWLLEILFNISIEDLDEDCIRRYSMD